MSGADSVAWGSRKRQTPVIFEQTVEVYVCPAAMIVLSMASLDTLRQHP